MYNIVRGAGCVIVAALILSASIIMAIEMANAIVVARNVESVQTVMTVVAHVTAERVAERSDRVRREEKEKCGPRPEQISEQLIRKHTLAMLSQEPIHRPRRHKMPDHRISIQQFAIRISASLHPHSLLHPTQNREPFQQNYSAAS